MTRTGKANIAAADHASLGGAFSSTRPRSRSVACAGAAGTPGPSFSRSRILQPPHALIPSVPTPAPFPQESSAPCSERSARGNTRRSRCVLSRAPSPPRRRFRSAARRPDRRVATSARPTFEVLFPGDRSRLSCHLRLRLSLISSTPPNPSEPFERLHSRTSCSFAFETRACVSRAPHTAHATSSCGVDACSRQVSVNVVHHEG